MEAGHYIVAALISGFIGYAVYWGRRRQKFNEIIYKERLALHVEILKRIWELYTAYFDGFDQRPQHLKLYNQAMDFRKFILGNGLLISSKAQAALHKLSFEFIEILTMKDLDEKLRQFGIIEDYYIKITQLLRNEFGIDAAAKETMKTLKSNFQQIKMVTEKLKN